mmetsp:Transcript_78488/g.182086  ORF Transcript_78488/g.182086 Transcript_78488/m.182086 type:complete len:209 (-) Transcript_78488:792-1418(-)
MLLNIMGCDLVAWPLRHWRRLEHLCIVVVLQQPQGDLEGWRAEVPAVDIMALLVEGATLAVDHEVDVVGHVARALAEAEAIVLERDCQEAAVHLRGRLHRGGPCRCCLWFVELADAIPCLYEVLEQPALLRLQHGGSSTRSLHTRRPNVRNLRRQRAAGLGLAVPVVRRDQRVLEEWRVCRHKGRHGPQHLQWGVLALAEGAEDVVPR